MTTDDVEPKVDDGNSNQQSDVTVHQKTFTRHNNNMGCGMGIIRDTGVTAAENLDVLENHCILCKLQSIDFKAKINSKKIKIETAFPLSLSFKIHLFISSSNSDQ
ncbi:UNVERIFIED_CONTAM: hypothetical protein NCL1_27690 [Trichonephila clavipes]